MDRKHSSRMSPLLCSVWCALVFTLSTASTVTPQNGCGGRLFSTHGELTPPLALTPDPLQCLYTISTEDPIYITLTRADSVGQQDLKVTDINGTEHDVAAMLKYELFGKWFRVEYQSADTEWFHLEWDIDVVGCNKTILSPGGFLRSPGYPFKYADNLVCTYWIESENVTKLVIDDLSIQEAQDLLQVTSVDFGGEIQHMFYTGDAKNLVQIGRDFEIRLTTDYYVDGRGFHLHWEPADAIYEPENLDPNPHNCDGFYMGDYGYLESPNYPNNYFPDSNCFYDVYSDQISEILVEIEDFKLAPQDVLVVNTSTVSDPIYFYGNYSLNDASPPHTFKGEYLTMEFQNNANDTDRGFRITWKPVPKIVDPTHKSETGLGVCRETYTSMYGSVMSPNYPEPYYNFADCFYTINTTDPIELFLNDLSLEYKYDTVEVRRYNGSEFETLIKLTGSHEITENLRWTGDLFQIYFQSDSINTKKGFNFVWKPASEDASKNMGTVLDDYGVTVSCGGIGFLVNIPTNVTDKLFPGVKAADLTFSDPSCISDTFPDVTQLYTTLMTCGMTREETDDFIIYKNIVQAKNSTTTSGSTVTRQDSPVLRVECKVNREASGVGFYWPKHGGERLLTGYGNFSLSMDMYRDVNRTDRFTSYPQPLELNQDVFVVVSILTKDKRLKIAPKTCVAKPTLNPDDFTDTYNLISSGCPAEKSVAIEDSPLEDIYFRFKAFEFLRNKDDVYVFCYVTVCKDGDANSGKCRRDCNTHLHRRRHAEDAQDEVYVAQGPLRIKRGFVDLPRKGDNSSFGYIPAIIIALSAVAMVTAAVVIVIMKRRK